MSASLSQGIPQRMTAFIDPKTGLITPSWWLYLYNLWQRTGAADSPASIDDLAGQAGATFLGGDSPDNAPDLSICATQQMAIPEAQAEGIDPLALILDPADIVPQPLLFLLSQGSSTPTLSTQLPGVPTATLGGNARGTGSIDLQNTRSSATQVASGTQAVAMGLGNTASATNSIAIGRSNISSGANAPALGDSNNATGNQAVAVGWNNQSTGTESISFGTRNIVQTGTEATGVGRSNTVSGSKAGAFGHTGLIAGAQSYGLGYKPDDRGNTGALVRSTVNIAEPFNKQGRSQIEEYTLVNSNSGAVAVRLTADGTAATAANTASVGTSFAASFTAEIIITDTTTNKSVTYSLAQSLIERQTTAASTTITQNAGGIVAGPTSAAPFTLAAAPTITADTANASFNVSYTPPVGNTDTFYAICYLRLVVLRYN